LYNCTSYKSPHSFNLVVTSDYVINVLLLYVFVVKLHNCFGCNVCSACVVLCMAVGLRCITAALCTSSAASAAGDLCTTGSQCSTPHQQPAPEPLLTLRPCLRPVPAATWTLPTSTVTQYIVCCIQPYGVCGFV